MLPLAESPSREVVCNVPMPENASPVQLFTPSYMNGVVVDTPGSAAAQVTATSAPAAAMSRRDAPLPKCLMFVSLRRSCLRAEQTRKLRISIWVTLETHFGF